MLQLNNKAHVHVTIRQLCLQLELLSGMKLVTDLGQNFNEIRFVDAYGYIVIDYDKKACFTLSHKLTNKEMATITDIMLYCNWLETGLMIAQKKGRTL